MPRRKRSKRIGDIAEDFVLTLIDRHIHWLAREQDKDYGIDLEAELAEPSSEDQDLVGKLLKVQVKGSREWDIVDGKIAVRIERKYLNYVNQFRLPVILVAADVDNKQAWFVWLQEWILQHETTPAWSSEAATIVVYIPLEKTLEAGLNDVLCEIARGETSTAMVLALRELAITAIALESNVAFEAIIELLRRCLQTATSGE